MAKYDALYDHLRTKRAAEVKLTFDEIGRLVPGGLPPSAYRFHAWWANERVHSQARAWLDAGFRARVSTVDRWVRFVKE